MVKPLHYQFVWGVLGGAWFDMANMKRFMDLIPAGSTWSTCGVGPAQFRGAFHAAVEGGHIRCGLEDNVTITKGVPAKGSWGAGREDGQDRGDGRALRGHPEEARQILGLKGGPEI